MKIISLKNIIQKCFCPPKLGAKSPPMVGCHALYKSALSYSLFPIKRAASFIVLGHCNLCTIDISRTPEIDFYAFSNSNFLWYINNIHTHILEDAVSCHNWWSLFLCRIYECAYYRDCINFNTMFCIWVGGCSSGSRVLCLGGLMERVFLFGGARGGLSAEGAKLRLPKARSPSRLGGLGSVVPTRLGRSPRNRRDF